MTERSGAALHITCDRVLDASGGGRASAGFSGADGWEALHTALGANADITALVAESETFSLDLPHMPTGRRDLRRMLHAAAPVVPDHLRWTAPLADPVTGRITVTLARTEWLDRRIGAIERQLKPRSLSVADAQGRAFGYIAPAERRRRWASAALAGLALLLALAAGTKLMLAMGSDGEGPRDPPERLGPPAAARNPLAAAPSVTAKPAPLVATPPKQTDAPAFVLVGIAGRLPDDVDVLVRPAWGKTTVLRVGDALMGWTLVSAAADRVTFARQGERSTLVLPAPP